MSVEQQAGDLAGPVDPPTKPQLRREMSAWDRRDWDDIASSAPPRFIAKTIGAGGSRIPGTKVRAWVQNSGASNSKLQLFPCLYAQLITIGSGDEPPLGPGSPEPSPDEYRELLAGVVARHGRGPGRLFVLGALCRYGRDSQLAEIKDALMHEIDDLPAKVPPAAAAADPAVDATTEDPTAVDLLDMLHELKGQAAALLGRLMEGADRLSDGRPLGADLLKGLAEWDHGLEQARQLCGAYTGLDLEPALSAINAQVQHVKDERDRQDAARREAEALARQEAERLKREQDELVQRRNKLEQLSEEISRLRSALSSSEATLQELPADLRSQQESFITSLEDRIGLHEAQRSEIQAELDAAAHGESQGDECEGAHADEAPPERSEDTPPDGTDAAVADQEAPAADRPGERTSAEPGAKRDEPEPSGEALHAQQERVASTSRAAEHGADVGSVERPAPPMTQPPAARQTSGQVEWAPQLERSGYGSAYWAAAAAGATAAQLEVLRFVVAALSDGGRGAADLSASFMRVRERDLDLDSLDPQHATLLALASLRASLALGFSVPGFDDDLLGGCSLDPQWREALVRGFRAAATGYRHRDSGTSTEAAARRSTLARDAEVQRIGMLSARTLYARASDVVHALGSPDGACGRALAAVDRVAGGDRAAAGDLEAFLLRTETERKVAALIREADRSLGEARNPIIGRALAQVKGRVDAVRVLAERAAAEAHAMEAESDPGHFRKTREQLLSDFRSLPVHEGTAEGVAAQDLRKWILNPVHPATGATAETLLRRASYPLTAVRRGEDNLPELDSLPATAVVIDSLEDDRTAGQWVEEYLLRGNFELAAEITESNGLPSERLAAARPGVTQHLQQMLAEVQAVFDRIQANHVVDEAIETDIRNRLVGVAESWGDHLERLDLVRQELDDLSAAVHTALASGVEQAASRLDVAINVSDQDRARIKALLDAGDIGMAGEYLLMVERNEPLPSGEASTNSELLDLMSVLSRMGAAGDLDDVTGITGGPDPGIDRAMQGMQAWEKAVIPTNNPANDDIRRILRLLGLDLLGQPNDATPKGQGRNGVRAWGVRATPSDGSIVPGLGSRAAKYSVMLIRESKRAVQLLDAISLENAQAANIILYAGVLSAEKRRDMLVEARRQRKQALIVDHAVVGLMAAKYPGSFRSLQRMALPFSTFEHYTPFVAGQVADEVFVGRTRELGEIMSPAGSLFVYGGRQLGKSALLRKAERVFNAADDRVAIYIDLKSHGIGEVKDPAHLWTVLGQALLERGVLDKRQPTGDAIVRRTKEWLQADEARHILLLLDEADLFLEHEAREKIVEGRSARFPNVGLLKTLMEDTDRRFKPVMAGLHQVGRFSHISNTPLAHGGRDILVGPLDRSAARDLVEKPLSALGFAFESQEVLWRFVGFANYQANLLQIACKGLLDHLRGRRPKAEEPPTRISLSDIEDVMGNPDVRDLIAERFNLTINLEDRYKVIALSMALEALSEGFGVRYRPTEILKFCQVWWNQGFEHMTDRDFRRYLEEMQGLGVLVINPEGTVSFRSPNVVTMLGNRDNVEQMLTDGSSRFDLPRDYNPTATRRSLDHSGAGRRHSPLTESELGELVPTRQSREPRLDIVIGSPATGVYDVARVITEVAAERGQTVSVLHPSEWNSFQTQVGNARTARADPLVLLTTPSATAISVAVDVLRFCQKTRSHAYLVLEPAAVEVLHTAGVSGDTMLGLSMWTDEALRCWDHPFQGRRERVALLAATGGWPTLVDQAVTRAEEGTQAGEVLRRAGEFPQSKADARGFLSDVGAALPRYDNLLRTLSDFTGPEDVFQLDDAVEIVDMSREVVEPIIKELVLLGVLHTREDGWAIDRVVRRALDADARQ